MKRFVIIICLALVTVFSYAQRTEEVTLVVSGEGVTKEEATNNALRSAIEQAFGVFVSAKTDILDDDIVKDEIATLTSGNIKSFSELSFINLPNGIKSITLQATVAIGNLIEYSKSHGSKAEFAGSIFGANLKMRQLNKQNEEMAIAHLIESIEPKNLFRIQLDLSSQPFLEKVDYYEQARKSVEPFINSIPDYRSNSNRSVVPATEDKEIEMYYVDMTLSYRLTEYGYSFVKSLGNILSSISLSPSEMEDYQKSNYPYCKVVLGKHEYYLRSLFSALSFYSLATSISFAMFDYWNLVIYTSDSKRCYNIGSPIFYPTRLSYLDVLSSVVPAWQEFFLREGLILDDDRLIYVEREYGLDQQRRFVKELMEKRYGIDLNRFLNRPLFHFRYCPEKSRRSELVFIPSNNPGAPLLFTYFVGRLPFSYKFNNWYRDPPAPSAKNIDSSYNSYRNNKNKIPTFSYDSFVFDSIDLHKQINPVVSEEEILIRMAFPEEELQEITAFQIERID